MATALGPDLTEGGEVTDAVAGTVTWMDTSHAGDAAMRMFMPLITAMAIASLMPVSAFAQQQPSQAPKQSQQGPAKNKSGNAHHSAPAGKLNPARTGKPVQKRPATRSPQATPDRHSQAPGPGANDWRRQGGQLPPGRGQVVNDYSRYHLAPPPAGYHWVQDGNDFLLAAVATGLITSIMIGSQN